MLGYVNIEKLEEKNSIKKYSAKVMKINELCKCIDVALHKKFDLNNPKHLKKIQKIFKKEKINKIVFNKKVFEGSKQIIDECYVNDINIVTGNVLYANMVPNVIEYIFDLANECKIEQIHLGIAVDLLSYNRLEFIKKMANKVRGITILTNTPSKFDNLCKEILQEYGLVIKCSDNFKFGLKSCDLCVNFDMDNSKIIGTIPNRCIFVNCSLPIKKIKKSFKGIVINDIVIDISDINLNGIDLSNFRTVAIAQAMDIENNSRSILKCIGINGSIDESEFEGYMTFNNKKV